MIEILNQQHQSFHEKYPLDEFDVSFSLKFMEKDSTFESYLQDLEIAGNIGDNIQQSLETDNNSVLQQTAYESLTRLNELFGRYQKGFNIQNPSFEAIRTSPYRVLEYSKESISEVIGNILNAIKEFLVWVSRKLKEFFKRIYYWFIDIPGDAKILLKKIENLSNEAKLDEKYAKIIATHIGDKYPSLKCLTSPMISSTKNTGLRGPIENMLDDLKVIEVPDSGDLSLGNIEKFTQELSLVLTKEVGLDVYDKFFSNEQVRDNIRKIEGIDKDEYRYKDVVVYNVGPRHVYYYCFYSNKDYKSNLVFDRVRLESMRKPIITMKELEANDVHLALKGRPKDTLIEILETIIRECPIVLRNMRKYARAMKHVSNEVRNSINKQSSDESIGDLAKNLITYQKVIKGIFKNYYREYATAKITIYSFLYRFCSSVYTGLVQSERQ